MVTFVVILLWTLNVRIYQPLEDKVLPMINDTEDLNTSQSITNIHTAIKSWPLIIIIGVWIWAILSTLRRDPNVSYEY